MKFHDFPGSLRKEAIICNATTGLFTGKKKVVTWNVGCFLQDTAQGLNRIFCKKISADEVLPLMEGVLSFYLVVGNMFFVTFNHLDIHHLTLNFWHSNSVWEITHNSYHVFLIPFISQYLFNNLWFWSPRYHFSSNNNSCLIYWNNLLYCFTKQKW